MKKKFWKMDLEEKIAYLFGRTIYDESELATWSNEDLAFYMRNISMVTETFLPFFVVAISVAIFSIALIIFGR